MLGMKGTIKINLDQGGAVSKGAKGPVGVPIN